MLSYWFMHVDLLYPCSPPSTSIQIIRNNTVLKGQLAYNLTEGGPSSSNPLWLVKFPNEKEEELYEHFFGKVLTSNDDKTMPPPSKRRPSSSSEGEQPKRVTFSESSPAASDDSSDGVKGGVSAREQRSRRRQAKVQHEPEVVHNTRKRSHAPLSEDANNKKMRNSEDAVVVKLLTGTLYLYKGAHRHAEFVRRV